MAKSSRRSAEAPQSHAPASPQLPGSPQQIASTFQADPFINTYCNHSKVGLSQWDFYITFGQIVETSEGTIAAKEEISIKFSPPYFKTLVGSMLEALQQWETTFGEIKQGLGQGYTPGRMTDAMERLRDMLEKSEKTEKSRGS